MMIFKTGNKKKAYSTENPNSFLKKIQSNSQLIKNKTDRPVAIYSKKFVETPKDTEKVFYSNKRATLYKTEMCRSFVELGICRYGKNCQFCHSESELRIVERHPKYKTEICKTFWLEGSCPYGRRCCFAHADRPNRKNTLQLTEILSPLAKMYGDSYAQLSPFILDMADVPMTSLTFKSPSKAAKTQCPLPKVVTKQFVGERDNLSVVYDNKAGMKESTLCFPQCLQDYEYLESKNDLSCKNKVCVERLIGHKTQDESFSKRSISITYGRENEGSFSPATPEELDNTYKSVWNDNAMLLWSDTPLLFLAKQASNFKNKK